MRVHDCAALNSSARRHARDRNCCTTAPESFRHASCVIAADYSGCDTRPLESCQLLSRKVPHAQTYCGSACRSWWISDLESVQVVHVKLRPERGGPQPHARRPSFLLFPAWWLLRTEAVNLPSSSLEAGPRANHISALDSSQVFTVRDNTVLRKVMSVDLVACSLLSSMGI